jgi:hypothetical protein
MIWQSGCRIRPEATLHRGPATPINEVSKVAPVPRRCNSGVDEGAPIRPRGATAPGLDYENPQRSPGVPVPPRIADPMSTPRLAGCPPLRTSVRPEENAPSVATSNCSSPHPLPAPRLAMAASRVYGTPSPRRPVLAYAGGSCIRRNPVDPRPACRLVIDSRVYGCFRRNTVDPGHVSQYQTRGRAEGMQADRPPGRPPCRDPNSKS